MTSLFLYSVCLRGCVILCGTNTQNKIVTALINDTDKKYRVEASALAQEEILTFFVLFRACNLSSTSTQYRPKMANLTSNH